MSESFRSPMDTDLFCKQVTDTGYFEDPVTGLWFKPGHTGLQVDNEFLPAPTPEQTNLCEGLAEALWHNWMKRKPGPTLDLFPHHNALSRALNKRTNVPAQTQAWIDPALKTQFSLVTMLNGFERIEGYSAINALVWAKHFLKPDGTLFIRAAEKKVGVTYPDYAVSLWDLDSFLELLYQAEDCFKLVETYPVGSNERDYLLKAIDHKPRVCIGMIAKNEERDLPRCLKSLAGVADGFVFVDTGSTDKTIDVAREQCPVPIENFHQEVYLEASEQDEKGDWKLWNFSKARNRFVDLIEQKRKSSENPNGYEWLLWMDADDELRSKKLKTLCYYDQYQVHAVQMHSGDLRWPHHRMWKLGLGIKYSGACHEYPTYGGKTEFYHKDIEIYHDAASGVGETSNSRNLRILERELAENPTPRGAFYLGNTYKDAGRWLDAVEPYKKRLAFGHGYADEYYFACLYLGRCLRYGGKADEARQVLLKAASEHPEWAEFWMELAYLEEKTGKPEHSLAYALLAKDLPVAPTLLFREQNAYKDQPYRLISWSYERMGDIENALLVAMETQKKIGNPDKDWDQRVDRLKRTLKENQGKAATRLAQKQKTRVCFNRPGALGDVLMTLNNVKGFKALYPDTYLIYRCHESIKKIMGKFILKCGIDEVLTTAEDARVEAKNFYNLVGYPIKEGYPEKKMEKHLLEYFAAEMGVAPDFSGLGPFPQAAAPMKRYVTIHAQAGWSQYKNWELSRWAEVVKHVQAQGFDVVQIGGPDDAWIEGVNGRATTFDDSLFQMSGATFHMGVDSWTNHATNILWEVKGKTRSLILWGSTQETAAGYPHNINLGLKLPCRPCFREDPKISQQPRGVCPHPEGQTYENPKNACMQGLTVEMVLKSVDKLIKLGDI